MTSVIVVGGGLAGLSATAALADAGFDVTLFESKPYLGGRATSYAVPSATGSDELIDNCQHILLRCCVNLLDFYRRLGVSHLIDFHKEFYFIEPGGRVSVFGAGRLPAPAHFTESFFRLRYLNWSEKVAVGRGLLALMRDARRRKDLDSITMSDWLTQAAQPPRAVERFWRQVLVSAVNEELDIMAAAPAFQVFRLGFLARSNSYEMGVPSVPLGTLYQADRWRRWPNVKVHLRANVQHVSAAGVVVDGHQRHADYTIVAVPWNKLSALSDASTPPPLESSPITGIHLWFDRSITDLPHATLLDRTLQWMFNQGGGRHIQLLVSASRSMTGLSRSEIVEIACRELAEYFPAVERATLVKSHVVKEMHATFSARPGLDVLRPGPKTLEPGVFQAGDWTRSGWPSTMEGAVRSGYLAAEAVAAADGRSMRFLLPDIG